MNSLMIVIEISIPTDVLKTISSDVLKDEQADLMASMVFQLVMK
jgi:hypothetical protein